RALLLRGHDLVGAAHPEGERLVEGAVPRRESVRGRVPGSGVPLDRDEPAVRIVGEEARAALTPPSARNKRRDPLLRHRAQSLAVDPGVEEGGEVAVEDLPLASRWILRTDEPEEPLEERWGEAKREQGVAVDLEHVRLFPIASREEQP